MKKLEPAFSSPQRHLNPSQDLQPFKRDQPSHPFVKRPPQHDSNPLNTSSSLIKTFSKNRINTQRPPNHQKESPARLLQRRSQSKSGNLKQVQRVSLSSQAYQQSPYMSSTSKLVKIGAIFCKKNQQQPKKLLTELYQQNEEYLQLLFQWQRLEIYDELDRQVYKLIQHHIKTVQDVLYRSFQDLEIKLKGYQNVLQQLQEQNKKLRESNNANQYFKTFISSLQNRVIEEFEKNQWSSLIFQQFGRQNFDLQAFVRKIPTFQQLIKSSQRKNNYQQSDLRQESLCKKLKIFNPSEIRLTKSIGSKQKPVQKKIQSHRQLSIFQK